MEPVEADAEPQKGKHIDDGPQSEKIPMVITTKDALVATINASEKWDKLRKTGPAHITMRRPNRSAR